MLNVSGLNAFYGSSQILHNLNLEVGAGTRVAVLGRNGAGKSTLFKSIMNAGPRTEGVVSLDKVALGDLPPFRRAKMGISLIPEDRRIFAHLTVRENLLLAGAGTAPGQQSVSPDELIRYFPMLEALQNRLGNQLSGGQQQMLAVARGIVPRPRLLMIDEPTEGLAPIIVQQLARAVNEIVETNKVTLLLSEQNLWFARRCTDRLYVLDGGIIVFHGDWSSFDADTSVKTRHLAV